MGILFLSVKEKYGPKINGRSAAEWAYRPGALNVVIEIAESGQSGERTAEAASAPNEIAVSLLQVLGPHSWIRCGNCHSKQPGGAACSRCGHALIFDIE